MRKVGETRGEYLMRQQQKKVIRQGVGRTAKKRASQRFISHFSNPLLGVGSRRWTISRLLVTDTLVFFSSRMEQKKNTIVFLERIFFDFFEIMSVRFTDNSLQFWTFFR